MTTISPSFSRWGCAYDNVDLLQEDDILGVDGPLSGHLSQQEEDEDPEDEDGPEPPPPLIPITPESSSSHILSSASFSSINFCR